MPVEAMQRMLGHERQEGGSSSAQKRKAREPGRAAWAVIIAVPGNMAVPAALHRASGHALF
jgi:hypothetical protein